MAMSRIVSSPTTQLSKTGLTQCRNSSFFFSPTPDDLSSFTNHLMKKMKDKVLRTIAEMDDAKDRILRTLAEMEDVEERTRRESENAKKFLKMKDQVRRTLAEMEDVKVRSRRESENAKKFAIQNFAKSLLDVADNLDRASSAAKESFSKIDASGDAAGVMQLKTLLEGVEMTEKQLSEVFKKFGLERYDPVNEEFDPNRHNALFQVPDASKPPNHVAVVLKAGYILHDRVIRPAEVGVTVASNS